MGILNKTFLIAALLALPTGARAEGGDFRVLNPGSPVRGNVYVADGPASLWSGNHSTYVANRFRLGLEIQWGRDYQWFAAWQPVDELSSAESAQPMGSLTRDGMDLDFGYFFVPDLWWVRYSFVFEGVRGDNVWGYKGTHGHGLSFGYRFYDRDKVNIAVELGYQYLQPDPITLIDNVTGAQTGASYPQAHVLSLCVRVGLDIGGR